MKCFSYIVYFFKLLSMQKFSTFKIFGFALIMITGLSACQYLPQELKPDWNLQFGTPQKVNEDAKMHLHNFDTFVCDGGRQITVTFSPDDLRANVLRDGKDHAMIRSNTAMPYQDGLFELFIMADGSLRFERSKAPLFKHCVPLVDDKGFVQPYTYTPTVAPEVWHDADPIFREKMGK